MELAARNYILWLADGQHGCVVVSTVTSQQEGWGCNRNCFFVFLSIFWFEHDHFRPFRNYWCEISRVTFPVIVMINVNKYTKLYLSEVCQMGLSAGCWQCKNVLCQHQWKSLTQPTTLNNHISIKYNSVFCLKKRNERDLEKKTQLGRWMNKTSVFFRRRWSQEVK